MSKKVDLWTLFPNLKDNKITEGASAYPELNLNIVKELVLKTICYPLVIAEENDEHIIVKVPKSLHSLHEDIISIVMLLHVLYTKSEEKKAVIAKLSDKDLTSFSVHKFTDYTRYTKKMDEYLAFDLKMLQQVEVTVNCEAEACEDDKR